MKKKLKRILKNTVPLVIYLIFCFAVNAYAEDMWEVANRIIVDVYNKIAGISTVLAALMTTICVVGMKLSNNQQKVDQSVDWLKRIWIAWAIIKRHRCVLSVCKTSLVGFGNDTVSHRKFEKGKE